MFGSSNVSNVVENTINKNIVTNGKNISLFSILIGIIFVLVLNLLLGPWLWNNILKKLVPGVGTARWYDTVALSLLLSLIIPH